MGMDLWGRERGSFDVNWGGWEPLVDFIKMFAANEAAPCADWESNDTPGLNAEETAKLAAKLEAAVKRGAVTNFLAIQTLGRSANTSPTISPASSINSSPSSKRAADGRAWRPS